MKRIAMVLFVGSLVGAYVLATVRSQNRNWKDSLVVAQSTRSDVEKLLGKAQSGQDYLVSYRISDGTIDIEYYPFDRCEPDDSLQPYWNLAKWTVTEISYWPDNHPKLASLHLDLKSFRKQHESPEVPDLVSYVNDEEGLSYTFEANGRLNSIRYFPGSRFDKFRCPKK